MIKTNYKIDDKVKSIKPGILNGIEGNVLSNNTEKQNRNLCVICGQLGTHYFSYSEVEFLGKEKPEKDSIDNLKFVPTNPKPEKRDMTFEEKQASKGIRVKRAYQKRDKSEPAKQKRAYNKKINL